MTGLDQGPPSLVAHVTPVVHSIGALAAAAGDRPLTSVIATVELGLILWIIRMLFTGRLITGREADERDQRYALKVSECEDLRSILAAQTEGLETSNALLRAFKDELVDRERTPSRPPTRPRATREDSGTGRP